MSTDIGSSLSPSAKEYINAEIRRYATWVGLTVLGLNIGAGVITILTFWSSVYTGAKHEYQKKLELLEKQYDAETKRLIAELREEHSKQLKSLKESVRAEFNYAYVKSKLTDITLEAGQLESDIKTAAAHIKASSDNAEHRATEAQRVTNDAQQIAKKANSDAKQAKELSNEALATAKKTSFEIQKTLAAIQTDDVEIARSIELMIKLMKDNGNEPLSKLNGRISTAENKIAEFKKSFQNATIRYKFESKSDAKAVYTISDARQPDGWVDIIDDQFTAKGNGCQIFFTTNSIHVFNASELQFRIVLKPTDNSAKQILVTQDAFGGGYTNLPNVMFTQRTRCGAKLVGYSSVQPGENYRVLVQFRPMLDHVERTPSIKKHYWNPPKEYDRPKVTFYSEENGKPKYELKAKLNLIETR